MFTLKSNVFNNIFEEKSMLASYTDFRNSCDVVEVI